MGVELIGLLQRRRDAEDERLYVEVLEIEVALAGLRESLAQTAERLRDR
jgi:hypothetical protein